MKHLEQEQRRTLLRLIAAAVLTAAVWLTPLQGGWKAVLWLLPYLAAGYEVLWDALKGLIHGELLDEDFLMAAATIGAFALGDEPEAVFVMLMFGIGELFEEFAEERSRRSIAEMMELRPDVAFAERGGAVTEVDPNTVVPGEIIVVKPGEKIPLDGEILEGMTTLNTAALTGEALPRTATAGDTVLSGCVNLSGVIRVKTTKPYGESTVAKILELVENAGENKGRSQRFITRFAKIYTPCVVAAAVLLAVVPPILTWMFGSTLPVWYPDIAGAPVEMADVWKQWIQRALVFLVVSCPCALVISVPLTYFGGIGGASKRGILVKGGSFLDALTNCRVAVFDKTGTLTKGRFAVSAVYPEGCSAAELTETAALAEAWSDHPIAQSLRSACEKTIDPARVTNAEELTGRGVRAMADGREVLAGNEKLMAERGIAVRASEDCGTVVHVAAEGRYLGSIVITDEVKEDAAETIAALKALGVRKTVMLTGDGRETAEAVGAALGIDEIRSQLLPQGKVAAVEELLSETSEQGKVVFVGDGINDAPVLRRADVGVAMGALGADAAIEAADVVLMDDRPGKLAEAIAIARRTKRIITENIIFAIGVKLLVLALAAMGLAGMWPASFADVGVCVIAVANAARTLKTR